MNLSGALVCVAFLISGAYNSVKELHFAERNYQSDRIKANVNNEANQKISGDSQCLIVKSGQRMCKTYSFHLPCVCVCICILVFTSASIEKREARRLPLVTTFANTLAKHCKHWKQIITICTHIFWCMKIYSDYMQRSLDHVRSFILVILVLVFVVRSIAFGCFAWAWHWLCCHYRHHHEMS